MKHKLESLARGNLNNLRYADDTTLMAESKEEQRASWWKWKRRVKKVNIQKTKIMAYGPITSWQIDGETVKRVTEFILGGCKITADGDWRHVIKRYLVLGRKVLNNLDSILKSRDINFANTGLSSQGYGFSSSHVYPHVYGCESWTIKKAKYQRIDAFELWCWRRLLRVPWTARRSNQSILKKISPGCSLEGLMLKLKLQYFGHLM